MSKEEAIIDSEVEMNTIRHHIGRDKNRGHKIDLEWEALAIMTGISLAIVIKLLWSLCVGLGIK